MKVYRGFDKQYGPILYDNWIYVTLNPQMAKWYATRNNSIKNGAIIEYDLDNNIKILDVEEAQELVIKEYDIEVSEDTLLNYCEEIYNVCSKYADGIKFLDTYSGVENEWIYIIFDIKNLHNPRELSPEEFNSIQLNETDYNEELNDVLRRAGIQINEEVEKPMIWNDPSYSQFHKILRDNTTYGKLSAIIDGNHIYCWDSAIRHHDSVVEQIEDSGIKISNNAIWVRFKEPNICWVSASYFDDYNDDELVDLPQQDFEKELENNPVIKKYFPNGVKITRFDNLVEKVVRVNKELTNTRLVTSAYELNEIIKHNTETRVLYDKQKDWFLIDNGEVSIHIELLNDALLDGIYPPFEWNGHICDGTGGDGIDDDGDTFYKMNPNRFVLFRTSSDPNNLMDYIDDRYTNCYYYTTGYYVFDRTGDFKLTPLYKLLGNPEYIEHWNKNTGEMEVLKESVGGNYLYHGTKLDVLFQILKDNVLQGSESTSGGGYNPYGVSTSRDLNFAYNFADISLHLNGDQDEDCRCVIVLDKDKLKNRYKIIPFRDENAFDVYDDDNTLYPELLEKEEIVLGDIQNVRNYIVGIYVSPDCKKLDTPEEIFSYYYNYLSYNELDRDDLETYVNEYADIINIIMNAKTFTNGRSQYNLRNNITETVVDAMDVNGYTTYMYKNPTMKELRDDKEANGEFRVVRVNDDFFFGDAGYWIHDYMDESDDAIRLFYNLNTNTFYQDFETISDEEYNEFYQNFVESMQEPYILNTFPNCKFKLFSKTKVDNDTPFGLVESVNKGIDFIAYHGGVEPDMTPQPNRALYLTDSYELAHQFARREIWNDGLYEGEIPTIFTFKGHFNNPYYMTSEEYDDEGQDDELDYQKWVDMGVDGIIIPPNDDSSSTYYIVIDLSTIKLVDKKVFYDEADLDDDY